MKCSHAIFRKGGGGRANFGGERKGRGGEVEGEIDKVSALQMMFFSGFFSSFKCFQIN